MSPRSNQLILSASIAGFGHHPGAPRGNPQRLTDIAHYRRLVQAAERGLLDFVLLHDERSVPIDRSAGHLDAITVLARLAPETRHVGLAASKPTTYTEPFHVSRELATLDFVSGGRAAWNATTSARDDEAQNFGEAHARPAEQRREQAEEFIAVSRKLWDSWEDDAVIADRERGIYLDPSKLHHIDHAGKHYQVRGPQITYRPPQGHVVVVQTDQGDAGEPLDATVADVLILHDERLEDAQRAYAHHHGEAAAAQHEVRVLQSILPVLGESEAEAQARAAALDAASPRGAAQPRALRLVGTPAQVAERLAEWFAAGAADGFHLLPDVLPDGLDELVRTLVPELQRRGLFRSAYQGRTLREHLGLARPISQYAAV
ncbi:LLM class flavin-dependent oxidoreductase [Chloroflexia bacterium SDU3-3]|nr:LLM class flavin-dependent oxidoreductase [Chloroflexia bacterium SDU3-3]